MTVNCSVVPGATTRRGRSTSVQARGSDAAGAVVGIAVGGVAVGGVAAGAGNTPSTMRAGTVAEFVTEAVTESGDPVEVTVVLVRARVMVLMTQRLGRKVVGYCESLKLRLR